MSCLLSSMAAADRPHIVLIMVDDMGFSDLGCYGGEIHTPNIDALAHGGVKFSNFYNASRCCPTRASLMTGRYPHQTGIGHMTNPPSPRQRQHDAGPEFPAYRGSLNQESKTIAERLKPGQYNTFMAGKWHLGMSDPAMWPLQRGFDRYYGCLSGATRYFDPVEPRHMTRDNEYKVDAVTTTNRPFYTTDAFTDNAISFIRDSREHADQPFFLYLAYTAPHWPHQAHEQDIDRYRSTYEVGYDVIRQHRHEQQKRSGLIDADGVLSPRPDNVPAWGSLKPEKQKELALRMAVYAAMIDRVDQNIGKLIAALKEQHLFDNTLILFLSDNGACAEGPPLGRGAIEPPEQRNQQSGNNYGAAWAHVSSTPFRLYKHFTHEGGAATPLIMHWPLGIKSQNVWYRDAGQVIDIVPTLLEVAEVDSDGDKLPGVSLTPAFRDEPITRIRPMFSEHEDNAFVIDHPWKLVGRGVAPPRGVATSRWELYDLDRDRTELDDLSRRYPARVGRMSAQWLEWAHSVGVYPKPVDSP